MAKKLYITLFVVVLLAGILLSIYLLWSIPPVNDTVVFNTTKTTQSELTVEEVEKQIVELNKSLGEATGFGEGYDITFIPSDGTTTIKIPSIILFARDTVTLKNGSVTELNHLSEVLRDRYSGKLIEVVGHTDRDPVQGSLWKDNRELSAQQAEAVARYLIESGISEDKIQASGCGGSKPRASNETSSGKALNRRIEIIVYMR